MYCIVFYCTVQHNVRDPRFPVSCNGTPRQQTELYSTVDSQTGCACTTNEDRGTWHGGWHDSLYTVYLAYYAATVQSVSPTM